MRSTPLDEEPPYAAAVRQLDELALGCHPKSRGWQTNANDLDSTTVNEWIAREVQRCEAQRSLRQVLEGLMTTLSEDMSMLTVLAYGTDQRFVGGGAGHRGRRARAAIGRRAARVGRAAGG